MRIILVAFVMGCFEITKSVAQRVPNEIENIDYLVTFGADSDPSWGDDDFIQTWLFTIPTSQKDPIFIRVFDPDTGGKHDEIKGAENTQVKFSIYGGKEAYSHPDVHQVEPKGNFRSGKLLASKIFGKSVIYDDKWYTYGPFSPSEGELSQEAGGYVFKVIAEGVSGDDGNMYRYFLSSRAEQNVSVEGGNASTYNYCFRLPQEPLGVTHIYPYVGENVIAITQHNFDFDSDGEIRIYSVAKNREKAASGSDNVLVHSKHIITPEEKNTTIDIQIVKGKSQNNNIVFYVKNEYNKPLPFYTNPIGGPPKYKYKVNVKYYTKDKQEK